MYRHIGIIIAVLMMSAGTAYHISYDNHGEAVWTEHNINIPEGISREDSARLTIEASFGKHSPNFAPPGTHVTTLIIQDEHIVINLSKNALSFGRDYYENTIRKQIIKTALEIEGIRSITTLVDKGDYYRYEKYTPRGSNPGPAD